MLQNIHIEIIKDDHSFHFIKKFQESICYAEYKSGEFILRLGLEYGDFQQKQKLIYKNVIICSHGIKSSFWDFNIYDIYNKSRSSMFPIKTLHSTNRNFEFYDKNQDDVHVIKIPKKNVEGIDDKTITLYNEQIKSCAEENSNYDLVEDHIINACIAQNKNIYDLIEDKDEFKTQISWSEDFEDLLSWMNNEDYDNDINFKNEVDIELERFSKNSFKYFQSFFKSEHLKDLTVKNLTPKHIFEFYPYAVQVIDENTLKLMINQYLINFDEKEFNDYKSINFDEQNFLKEVLGDFFYKNLKKPIQTQLREKFTRNTLYNIYSKEINTVENQEDLLNELEKYVGNCIETDEQSLLLGLKDFINKYLVFADYYKKFNFAFGSKSMRLNLTADKEARFIAFENGEIELNEQEQNEYDLVFKIVMPIYMSYMYVKGKNKLKPTIKQIPLYFDYIKTFFDRLIKDEIIVEDNGLIDFKDISKLGNLEKEIYDPSEYYKKSQMRLILKEVKENPYITNKLLAEKISYSIDFVKKILNDLSDCGYIEKTTDGGKRYLKIKKEL